MKITDVTTTLIYNPDAAVIQDATIPPPKPGTSGRTTIFIHIHTDEGTQGFSYLNSPSAVRSLITDNLKDILIGKTPFETERIWTEMFWRVRGFGRKGLAFQAMSALDVALWDLKGKALGIPLYKLLGQAHDSVPCYGSGGWTNYTVDELVAEQTGYVDMGFPRIKMKVGKDFGMAERADMERLEAVRKAVGDDVEIFVDANNGYYAKQAIRMSRKFEDYDVGWFEEPVLADDIQGLATISAATNIPVATGEHEYTKYGFKELISRGGADIVQPDIGRVGGVTEWMKVTHLADAYNLPIAPHAYSLLHLHCTMATPNLKVVEVLGGEMKSWPVLFTEVPWPVDGQWKPFEDRPGLGLEPNPDTMKNLSVDSDGPAPAQRGF